MEFAETLKFLFKLTYAVGYLLVGWKQVGDAVGGYAYGLLLVAFECPSGYHIVLFLANEQADGIPVIGSLDLMVDA